MNQESFDVPRSARPERLGVISCGYESGQLNLKDKRIGDVTEYDIDRRAVDVAIVNAQGDRAIAWWPIYQDALPGDLVIFNLAAHQRVRIDDEVMRRAKRYANQSQPGIPTHPELADGTEGDVCAGRVFHGLALIRSTPLHRSERLVEAKVGHVVLFPRPLTPIALPSMRLLGEPTKTCSERWDEGKTWLSPDLSRRVLAELEAGADGLFGEQAYEFRADLKALRKTAATLREGVDDPAILSAISAPHRWIEQADSKQPKRRTARFGVWSKQVRCDKCDALWVDLDKGWVDKVAIDSPLGVPPDHWLRKTIESGPPQTRESRFAALVVRDIFEPAEIKETLVAVARGGDSELRRAWLPQDRVRTTAAKSRSEVFEAVLNIDAESQVHLWLLVDEGSGDPATAAGSGRTVEPVVRVVAMVPSAKTTLADEKQGGQRVFGLEPYATNRLLGLLATVRESQSRLFDEARDCLDGVDGDEHREAVAALRTLRSGRDRGSGQDAVRLEPSEAMVCLERVHRGCDVMRVAHERLVDGLDREERSARSLVGPSEYSVELLDAITAPLRLAVKRLERGYAILETLAARANELFAFRTSLDMRDLLDQAESAKFALRVVGAVSVMIAAFALYTSAAAVPEGGDDYLFRVSTDAVAATVVAIVAAVIYGGVIAFMVKRAGREREAKRYQVGQDDSLRWVSAAAAVLIAGAIPSGLRLVGVSVPEELTIGAGLAGLGVAGVIGARYARLT